MNNMAGVNLLGKRGRELQDLSVLLIFLCDLNMNHTSVESLFLPKQVSVALWIFKFCGKQKSSLKTMTSVSSLIIHAEESV